MIEMSVLIKERKGPELSPLCKDTRRMLASARQELGLQTDPYRAGTLTSDLPASRTSKTKCLLLKPSCLWYLVAVAQEDRIHRKQ